MFMFAGPLRILLSRGIKYSFSAFATIQHCFRQLFVLFGGVQWNWSNCIKRLWCKRSHFNLKFKNKINLVQSICYYDFVSKMNGTASRIRTKRRAIFIICTTYFESLSVNFQVISFTHLHILYSYGDRLIGI